MQAASTASNTNDITPTPRDEETETNDEFTQKPADSILLNKSQLGLPEKKEDETNKELLLKLIGMVSNMQNQINSLQKQVANLQLHSNLNANPNSNPLMCLSNIIRNQAEKKLIKDEITKKFKKAPVYVKKLFNSEEDGDSPRVFHQKCDDTPNTLVVIKTTDGKRFGGFTAETWNHSGYKNDYKAFLFSLDNMEIYNYNNDGCAIYCHNNYGPLFGSGYDIMLYEDCMKNNSSFCHQGSYQYKGKANALNGKENFQVEKYEVYQVGF